tara:strand:- start:166 stop:453 length:288 start_codon:yes stop_codon:yes gene_type:complete
MDTRKFIQDIINKELTMCFADCSQDNIDKWVEILERYKEKLTLTDVGCSLPTKESITSEVNKGLIDWGYKELNSKKIFERGFKQCFYWMKNNFKE